MSQPSFPHQPGPPIGYGQPGPVGHAAHPSRATATAAIWASALGFFCLPLLGSIVGIVLGRSAQRGGYPGGRARTAIVLGWIGLVLLAISLVVEGFARLFS